MKDINVRLKEAKREIVQELEYEFPYHYIPRFRGGVFSQTFHYSWGFRYLGGLKLVEDELVKLGPKSLVDIGCGDGRFLSGIVKNPPNVELLGIDYSSAAIAFAKAFNPDLNYKVHNILDEPLSAKYDVATLIEVLEHIQPKEVTNFLRAVSNTLCENGRLIITVPHKNSPLISKHYQHFDSASLRECLSEHFDIEEIRYFDSRRDITIRFLKTFLGGGGSQFVITNRMFNRFFMKMYVNYYLKVSDENDCRRMLAVVKRK